MNETTAAVLEGVLTAALTLFKLLWVCGAYEAARKTADEHKNKLHACALAIGMAALIGLFGAGMLGESKDDASDPYSDWNTDSSITDADRLAYGAELFVFFSVILMIGTVSGFKDKEKRGKVLGTVTPPSPPQASPDPAAAPDRSPRSTSGRSADYPAAT